MRMELLSKRKMLCISCMEEHDVQIVRTTGHNIFKGALPKILCKSKSDQTKGGLRSKRNLGFPLN